MATDYSNYINFISIATPIHYSVCGNAEKKALGQEVTCAFYALLPQSAYPSLGENIVGKFNLRWTPTQREDCDSMGVMVFKRYWEPADMMFIDILHYGPMGK